MDVLTEKQKRDVKDLKRDSIILIIIVAILAIPSLLFVSGGIGVLIAILSLVHFHSIYKIAKKYRLPEKVQAYNALKVMYVLLAILIIEMLVLIPQWS